VRRKESNAPALMRLSTTRRLTRRRSTRAQKSTREAKAPSCSRALIMDSMAEAPTFLMAARPKWITSLATVKRAPDTLTSGGSTRSPMLRHSSMYWTILSVFSISDVSSAAMNSTGWLALKYAVW